METNDIILPDFAQIELEQAESSFMSWLHDNPNNFSFWFPKIRSCGLPMPGTVIIPVPEEVIRSEFLERDGDRQRITDFIKDSVLPAIPKEWNGIFIKNGCFSDKFDFSLCHPKKGLKSISHSFREINMDSLAFDTGGNAEFVIREYIEGTPEDNRWTIYNGMPLRPEVRVFYDFSRKRVLYSANYWDWDYCHDSICSKFTEEKNNYEAAYPHILEMYEKEKGTVESLAHEHFKDIPDIEGFWSADFMLAGGQWWLIDMAIAGMSAYWDPHKAGLQP